MWDISDIIYLYYYSFISDIMSCGIMWLLVWWRLLPVARWTQSEESDEDSLGKRMYYDES